MEARVAALERIAHDTAAVLGDLRGELRGGVAGLRGEIRDVRSDMRDERRDAKGRQVALIGTIIATGLAVAALAYTTQANLLAAFQTGLAAVQSAGGHDAPQPIIIQVPIPAASAPVGSQTPATPPPRNP